MNQREANNILAFLQRTDLKGSEVDAFLNAVNSVKKSVDLPVKKKEDKERLTSLISLTKGLNAYGQANMQSTKQCFSEIKDIKLAKDVKEKSKKYLGVEVAQ